MKKREITSRDHADVKHYVQLAGSRKERHEQRLFVTEGIKLTCEAFDAGCTPVVIFATEDATDRYYDHVQRIMLACESFYRISQSVADKLAQSVSPQGVFGVFRMLDNETQPVKISSNGKMILLSSLQDPGNIGTILRTAAAFGIDGVVLSSDCPDLYSPKVLRSTMGGVFKIPLAITSDLGGYIDQLRGQGIPVYAAALNESAVPVLEASLQSGCAVVIGNEGNGISEELIDRCDGTLMIPMKQNSESLNAAMAAGIVMWEMTK
ncbi:RNA methyltransferase [Oscillospiraceae bacterium PP1C4]